MSVQKKSLISKRATVKKALVATSSTNAGKANKIASPYKIAHANRVAVSTPNRIAHLNRVAVATPNRIAHLNKVAVATPNRIAHLNKTF